MIQVHFEEEVKAKHLSQDMQKGIRSVGRAFKRR